MLIRVLMVMIVVNCVQGDMNNFVNIIFAVQEYFTSGCIYLLHDNNEHLNASLVTVAVSKLMFQKFVRTSLSSSNVSKDCQRNRPLYVISDKDSGYSRSLKRSSLQTPVWLKFLETEKATDFFENKDVPFDCEFLIAVPVENGSVKYRLTEVYRVNPFLPFNTYHFGNWDPSVGLIHPQIGFYERRRTLHGAVLKTAVAPTSPFLLPEDIQKSGNYKKDLFDELWLLLSKEMNFTPVYLYPERNVHGMKLENGSWNGLMGLIQRKEAEISCESLTMSPSRAEIVDFMVPIRNDRHYLIIKKTDVFELNWSSFLLPFSTEIWLAVIITIIILALILWGIYKIGCYCWKENSDILTPYELHDSLFYVFGSFCQQGHDKTPVSISGRVVYLVSYLTAVVLLAGYSASLISYLTLRKPVVPFTSFAGLLEDSSYKFGLTPFSSMYSYFEETKDPLIHKLYEKFVRYHGEHLPATSEDGLHRVCKEHKYTFLSSLDILETIELTCRLLPVSEAFIPGSRAMAVVRNSPYLGIFSHYLLKLRSAGILKKLELSASRKSEEEEKLFVNMDLLSVAPIFGIAAFGITLSIVVLFIEILIGRGCAELKKHNRQQNEKDSRNFLKSVSFVCKRRPHRETWKINFTYK